MFSPFQVFPVFTIFPVWRVEISFTTYLPSPTCKRTWYLRKHVYSFFQIFDIFFHFLHFKLLWRTYYSQDKNLVVDHSPGPMIPIYHAFRFCHVEMCEGLCLKKCYGWQCNPSHNDNRSNPKRSKGKLTSTQAALVYKLDMIWATKRSTVEVKWCTHALFEWRNNLQNTAYFCCGYHAINC